MIWRVVVAGLLLLAFAFVALLTVGFLIADRAVSAAFDEDDEPLEGS